MDTVHTSEDCACIRTNNVPSSPLNGSQDGAKVELGTISDHLTVVNKLLTDPELQQDCSQVCYEIAQKLKGHSLPSEGFSVMPYTRYTINGEKRLAGIVIKEENWQVPEFFPIELLNGLVSHGRSFLTTNQKVPGVLSPYFPQMPLPPSWKPAREKSRFMRRLADDLYGGETLPDDLDQNMEISQNEWSFDSPPDQTIICIPNAKGKGFFTV